MHTTKSFASDPARPCKLRSECSLRALRSRSDPFSIAAIATLVLCATATASAQSTTSEIDDDWTRIVPGDVRFYVEMNDLADVRKQFRRMGIWSTVVEIREQGGTMAGQPSWQIRTRELLGLDAEEVITELLGQRSAIMAVTPAEWDNGVLLAELADPQTLERLLKAANAKSLAPEGAVRRYQLASGLTLAHSGRLIAIGPAADPDELWSRTVLLMSGQRGPSLSARADFAALRSRLSPQPQGLLYTVRQPSEPAVVADCRRLLVGVWLEPDEIICEIRGHRAERSEGATAIDSAALERMPATTLAAWVGQIDFPALRRRGLPAEDFSLAYLFLATFGQIQIGERSMLESLGPNGRIIVARDPPGLATGFDLPAITTILDAREADGFIETLDTLMDIMAKSLTLMTTGGDESEMKRVGVKTHRCEDVELHSVAMGPALARRLGISFLRKMEPCWAVLDGQLVISSSKAHVEEIVRALRGKGPRLTQTAAARRLATVAESPEPVAEFVFLRSHALSAMLSNWLSYVEENHPQALRAEWWRSWATQRMAERLRLGVALETDKQEPNRAVVVEISEASPAWKYLMHGDIVLAAAGRPLGEKAAQDVAERYRNRRDAEHFELQVLRGDETLTVRIPVQPVAQLDLDAFDPARSIRQLAALARCTETVTFCRYLTRPERFDARLIIRWRTE